MTLQVFLGSEFPSPKIVMLCGLAGSGKSTVSKNIARDFGYTRLSIDQILAETYGLYGVDYPAEDYERISELAMRKLEERFRDCLDAKQDVVLDRSFWSVDDRKACYQLLEEKNIKSYCLVYLRAGKETLWKRIETRRKEILGPDNARQISRDLFEQFWNGFNVPEEGENAIIIDVEASAGPFGAGKIQDA